MRAIHRNDRVQTWRTLLALISSGVVILAVLGTGPALAATPHLIVTGSGPVDKTGDTASTAQPTIVSTNDTVQFTTSIYNDDTSNVSQLYFDILGDPAAFSVIRLTPSGLTSVCSPTGTLPCSFGALRPGESVTMTVILKAPSLPVPTAPSAKTSCAVGSTGYLPEQITNPFGGPAFCVTLRWYANGSPTADSGNNSHGDYFDWLDGAGLNADAVNFKGRFVNTEGTTKTVSDGPTISKSNRQSTSAVIPDFDLPATVADESGVTETFSSVCLNTAFDCGTLTSAWSQVNVANGKDFQSLNKPISITIRFYQAPTNLKGKTPHGYHTWFDPASSTTKGEWIGEWIYDACVTDSNDDPTTVPCLTVTNAGRAVTILTWHNGGMRF